LATERLPAYVQVRRLADGRRGYFWVRPQWAKPPALRHGKTCPVQSSPLGQDVAVAITRANALNGAFKEWREGEGAKLVPGTVRWLFDWYRRLEKFTALRHNTRTGYKLAMDMVEAIDLRAGTFGQRRAAAVDATAADGLYRKAKEKHGERQGSYMMQVCRLVWNQAARHNKATGVKENPFAGMGIKSSSGAGRGNRAATRAEYEAYKATAAAMGRQSMATAAAICFEGCQRVYDAFGFEDPDGRISRGVRWGSYEPGQRIGLVQSKTGNVVSIPLVDGVGDDVVELYPELEAEIARVDRGEPDALIVRDERTGEPYTPSYQIQLHRRIRTKAGLSADLKFTSFRHGGITELGDSGTDDVRAVSGHKTLNITGIYNKANDEKGRRIAARRREHIATIAGPAALDTTDSQHVSDV
jgi:integrase